MGQINDKSKKEQNGYAIRNIKNPSEKAKLAAVKQNGKAILFINNPSEEVQLAAVNQNVFVIKHIIKCCGIWHLKRVQLAAVNQNGKVMRYLHTNDKEIQLASLWDFGARKYVNVGLELPTIHYKWIHDDITTSEIFFKKNLNDIKKYSDINFKN